jgi:hypothetical protein
VFLADAVRYINGAPERVMIDNTHVVVLRGTGREMIPGPEMEAFADHLNNVSLRSNFNTADVLLDRSCLSFEFVVVFALNVLPETVVGSLSFSRCLSPSVAEVRRTRPLPAWKPARPDSNRAKPRLVPKYMADEVKEVYARFGLAYYMAEVVHRGLCNLCCASRTPKDGPIIGPRVEEHLRTAFETTLGPAWCGPISNRSYSGRKRFWSG